MAETIRDVIIKIRLDQEETKLKVPDIEPSQNAYQELGDIASKQLEAITSGTEEISNEILGLGNKLDDLAAVGQKALDQLEKEATHVPESLADITEEAEKTQREINDLAVSAADGFISAGEGALTFARGVGFLTADTEESFQKLIENVAQVQGGIDLLKGSSETLKGLRDGYLAIADAGGIAAVTQNAVASANTAVATTGRAASGAMATLTATLGPVGTAVTGVTVAVGALTAAWYYFSEGEAEDGMEKTAKSVDEVGEAAKRTLTVLEEIRNVLESTDIAASGFDVKESLLEQLDALDGQVNLQKQLKRLEGERANQMERLDDAFVTAISGEGAFQIDTLEQAMQAVEALGVEFTNTRSVLETITMGTFVDDMHEAEDSMQVQLGATETLVQHLDTRMQHERGILDVLDDQAAAAEKQLMSAQKSFETTKEQLSLEKDRLESLDEVVGRMDAIERQEFKKLTGKVEEGGELSKEELERFSELGGSAVSDYVSEQYAKKGKKFGGAEIFEPILGELRGEGSKLDTLKQQRQELLEELRQQSGTGDAAGEEEILEAMREQVRSQRENQEEQIQLLMEMNEEQQEFKQRLAEIRQQFEESKNQL